MDEVSARAEMADAVDDSRLAVTVPRSEVERVLATDEEVDIVPRCRSHKRRAGRTPCLPRLGSRGAPPPRRSERRADRRRDRSQIAPGSPRCRRGSSRAPRDGGNTRDRGRHRRRGSWGRRCGHLPDQRLTQRFARDRGDGGHVRLAGRGGNVRLRGTGDAERRGCRPSGHVRLGGVRLRGTGDAERHGCRLGGRDRERPRRASGTRSGVRHSGRDRERPGGAGGTGGSA